MATIRDGREAPATARPDRAPLARTLARALASATLATTTLSTACVDAAPPTAASAAATLRLAPRAAQEAEAIPGQWIVTFTDDVGDAPGLARRIVAEHGGELRFAYSSALKGFAATLPDAAVAALRRNPQVALVEQDALVREADVQTGVAWGLDRIDQRALPFDQQYAFANRGDGVNVYIIDTGIRSTHAEFGGRVRSGFTAFADGRGTEDCRGHGTHVAGSVGGATFGVAKAVTLYAVRVLDCTGSGSYSSVIAGVDWVTQHRLLPAVANMSLGASASSTLDRAVRGSIASGVTYVVAAGNGSTDACSLSPAGVTDALTVGASDATDAQAYFSNYGRCVDLYAPGVSILSAYALSDTAVATYDGTSMASPHVAGAAALYLAANRSASPAAVHDAVLANATTGRLRSLGSGSPDRLLFSAFVGVAPVPNPPPPTGDAPPVAGFSASCNKGLCSFDAGASTDDGGIVTYAWDFGDGTSASAASSARTTHAYAVKGSYVVTLTVTDAGGQSARTTRTVTIRKA